MVGRHPEHRQRTRAHVLRLVAGTLLLVNIGAGCIPHYKDFVGVKETDDNGQIADAPFNVRRDDARPNSEKLDATSDLVARAELLIPEQGQFFWPCTFNEECVSGLCVVTNEGGRCTMLCNTVACPTGWICVEERDMNFICVPSHLTLCNPCSTDDDCIMPGWWQNEFLALCLEHPNGAGSFCGTDCAGGQLPCPAGYSCELMQLRGETIQQCMPENGTCECSFLAIQESISTSCFNMNEFGKCEGTRSCTAGGLSECSAPTPEQEKCNDVDDDCDNNVDEGCDDDHDGFCDFDMTTIGVPISCGNGGGDCNDGDASVFPGASEQCDKKDNDCDGVIDNGLCNDGNPCTDDLCDPEEGCSHPRNAAPCDDGNACTENDHCFEGTCQGAPKSCDDGNPCNDDSCNPVAEGGCIWVNNTNPCDDDGNPCSTDVCENGACQHKLATGIPCDDGNPCTDGDSCKSGQCVSGPPKNCDDEEPCTADSCDPAKGCTNAALTGNACTYGFVACDLEGTCGSKGCVPQSNCQCPNCTHCICCGLFQLCCDGACDGS